MKVLLAGELRTQQGSVPCRLLDLSRGGAGMDVDQPQPVGAQVALTRGPLSVTGKIAWAQGRRCGIRFDDPIRATDLFVQLSVSRHVQAQPVNAPWMLSS